MDLVVDAQDEPDDEGASKADEPVEPAAGGKRGRRGRYWRDLARLAWLTWPLFLGNALEHFELGVYSYVEREIAENFFDGSELGSWLGFAITAFVRPLGGFLFGWIADNWGRKASVNLSLAGMLMATVGQGLMPGARLGSSAEGFGFAGLVACRLLQGLAAGGEIGAVACWLMEVSPLATLGMTGCLIQLGSQSASALAAGFIAALSSCVGSEAMLVWGWRVPFLITLLPGLLALRGRNSLVLEVEEEDSQCAQGGRGKDAETPAQGIPSAERPSHQVVLGTSARSIPSADRPPHQLPRGIPSAECPSRQIVVDGRPGAVQLLVEYWPALLIGSFGTAGVATMWYAPPFWTLSALLSPHLGSSAALWIGSSVQVVGLLVSPLSGWLVDRHGVGLVVFAGAVFFAAIGLPVYCWLVANEGSTVIAFLGVGVFYGVAQGISGPAIFLFVGELFPQRIRCQGMAASYNIAVSFLGGFGGAISQAIFDVAPAYGPGLYFSATGLVSAITVPVALAARRRHHVRLAHRRGAPYFGHEELRGC